MRNVPQGRKPPGETQSVTCQLALTTWQGLATRATKAT